MKWLMACVGIFVFTTCPVVAQAQSGLTLDYNETGVFAVGKTADISNILGGAREDCLEFDLATLQEDAQGTTDFESDIKIVSNFEEYTKTFDKSLDWQIKSNASFADALSASGELTGFVKHNEFLKNINSSILIEIFAKSSFGREYIPSYKLKSEYESLSQSDTDEFRSRCGTHYVFGANKVAELRYIILVNNMSKNNKTTLDTYLRKYSKGKFGVGKFSGGGETDIKIALKRVIETATRSGNVSYDVKFRGGNGIETLSKLIPDVPPEDDDYSNIIKAFKVAASDFTKQNSAPDQYILAPHPSLSFNAVTADQSKYLRKAANNILEINSIIAKYDEYKSEGLEAYDTEFEPLLKRAELSRKLTVKRYQDCFRKSEMCQKSLPSTKSFYMLEDALSNGELTLECSYDYKLGDKWVVGSVTPVWRGELRYFKDLDLHSTEVFFGEEDNFLKIANFKYGDYFSVDPEAFKPGYEENTARAIMSFLSTPYEKERFSKVGDTDKIDVSVMQSERLLQVDKTYLVKFKTKSGKTFEAFIGPPNGENCPYSKRG